MRQHKVMIHLEERQLLTQSVYALTRCGAAPPYRRYPLTQTQIEPFHKRGVGLPAAGGQDLLHRSFRAEHDTVLYLNKAPAPHRFDDLCIEQFGPRHPAWLGL